MQPWAGRLQAERGTSATFTGSPKGLQRGIIVEKRQCGQEMSCPWAQLYLQAFFHILDAALLVCLKGDADCSLVLLLLLRPLGHQTCKHSQGYSYHQAGTAGMAWGAGDPTVARHCPFPCTPSQKALCPSQQPLSCSGVPDICTHPAGSWARDPNPSICFWGEGEVGRKETGDQGGCVGLQRRLLPLPLHGSVGIWTV